MWTVSVCWQCCTLTSLPPWQMARHELPEYVHSGIKASEKIRLGRLDRPVPAAPEVFAQPARLESEQEQILARAFPGTEHDMAERNLFQIVGPQRGVVARPFNTHLPQTDDFVITHAFEEDTPFQLCRVRRTVSNAEGGHQEPVVIFEVWQARRTQSHDNRPNIYGRWNPMKAMEGSRHAAKRLRGHARVNHVGECTRSELYCWPVTVVDAEQERDGRQRQKGSVFIQFEVFDFLYLRWNLQLTGPQFAFTERGHEYARHLASCVARA